MTGLLIKAAVTLENSFYLLLSLTAAISSADARVQKRNIHGFGNAIVIISNLLDVRILIT